MADVVQRRLEDMVPELDYLLKARLLSRAEVRALVRRRRAFEYRLHRRQVQRLDYLRYVRHELALEELLRLREAAQGAEPRRRKERFGGVRRVVRLVWALVHRWGFDPAVADTALRVVAALPNHRLLPRLFARLLQLHPTRAELWIQAARYEFASNQNVAAARGLFQRALRSNAQNEELWEAYLRLEATHWQLVLDARGPDADVAAQEPEEAGADAQAEGSGQGQAKKPDTARPLLSPGAAAAGFEAVLATLAGPSGAPATAAPVAAGFLALGVPRRVVAESLRAAAGPCPGLVRRLLGVLADFLPHALGVALDLLQAAAGLLAAQPAATAATDQLCAVLARAPFVLQLGASPAQRLALCAGTFAAARRRWTDRWQLLAAQLELYGELATGAHGAPPPTPSAYDELFAQLAPHAALLPEPLLRAWTAYHRAARPGRTPPAPPSLRADSLRALLAAGEAPTGQALAAVVQLFLRTAPPAELAALLLDVLVGSAAPRPATELSALATRHLAPAVAQSPALLEQLLSQALLAYGPAAARSLAAWALALPGLPAAAYLVLVRLEQHLPERCEQHAKALLERAVAQHPSDSSLWLAYAAHASGRAADAAAVYWRARRALDGPELARFEQLAAPEPRA